MLLAAMMGHKVRPVESGSDHNFKLKTAARCRKFPDFLACFFEGFDGHFQEYPIFFLFTRKRDGVEEYSPVSRCMSGTEMTEACLLVVSTPGMSFL